MIDAVPYVPSALWKPPERLGSSWRYNTIHNKQKIGYVVTAARVFRIVHS